MQGAAIAPLAAVPLVLSHLVGVRVVLDVPLPLLDDGGTRVVCKYLGDLLGLLGDGIGGSLGRDEVKHDGSPVARGAQNIFQGSTSLEGKIR